MCKLAHNNFSPREIPVFFFVSGRSRCVGDQNYFFSKIRHTIFGASVLRQLKFVRHLLPPGTQVQILNPIHWGFRIFVQKFVCSFFPTSLHCFQQTFQDQFFCGQTWVLIFLHLSLGSVRLDAERAVIDKAAASSHAPHQSSWWLSPCQFWTRPGVRCCR